MATVKELEAELAEARADIAALASLAADRGADRASGVADAVQNILGDLSDEGRAAFERARAEGEKLSGRAVDEIRNHPVGAVAVGVAVGALLTMVLRR